MTPAHAQSSNAPPSVTSAAAGGQAKRTNIGVALISAPRILFLDEPTSGLDSYTSLEVLAGCNMDALLTFCHVASHLSSGGALCRSCSMWRRSRPLQGRALAHEAAV